ncbi:hypothetical protein ESCOCP327M_22210 [Escherichia coli]
MDSVHHIWCPLFSQEFQDLPDGAETTLTLGESRLANRLNSLLRRFDDRDLYHTLIWLCWYDLMCAHSMQPWTEELKHKSHAELESWAVARKREKRELELMIDEYLLYAC